MYDVFDFDVLQGRYVKAAMDKIAMFRPDGQTPAGAQALIDAALGVRTTFQTAFSARNLARGTGGIAHGGACGVRAGLSDYETPLSRRCGELVGDQSLAD